MLPYSILLTEDIDLEEDLGIIQKFIQELPDKALKLGIRVLLAVLVFLIGMKIIKAIRKIVKRSMNKANAEISVVAFMDSLIKYGLYIVLIFLIAAQFGVDAASIVAILGSAGVAVGLALQGSLSNLAGGVLILMMKPFKIGDYIKEDGHGNEGEVTDIQIFYTKLLTPEHKIIVLPNGNLANSSLSNYSSFPTRRLDITVGISYKADIKKAKTVLIQMLKDDPAVIESEEMNVYVQELADSAVLLNVRCFTRNADYWDAKWRLTEKIKETLDENGVEIPFPQLDVHLGKAE